MRALPGYSGHRVVPTQSTFTKVTDGDLYAPNFAVPHSMVGSPEKKLRHLPQTKSEGMVTPRYRSVPSDVALKGGTIYNGGVNTRALGHLNEEEVADVFEDKRLHPSRPSVSPLKAYLLSGGKVTSSASASARPCPEDGRSPPASRSPSWPSSAVSSPGGSAGSQSGHSPFDNDGDGIRVSVGTSTQDFSREAAGPTFQRLPTAVEGLPSTRGKATPGEKSYRKIHLYGSPTRSTKSAGKSSFFAPHTLQVTKSGQNEPMISPPSTGRQIFGQGPDSSLNSDRMRSTTSDDSLWA